MPDPDPNFDARRTLRRRDFLRSAAGAAGTWIPGIWIAAGWRPLFAGPLQDNEYARLIPADKKLDPAWVRSLTERGKPQEYSGEALDKIGMPIGGLFAGGMYLSGDGRLWLWDIFNKPGVGLENRGQNGETYVKPLDASAPAAFRQGFAIRAKVGNVWETRTLDRRGFPAARFRGEYPVATVTYADPKFPIEVRLEAFSPFVPLEVERSNYPATVLQFTLRNRGGSPTPVELLAYLENPVLIEGSRAGDQRFRNRARASDASVSLGCSVVPRPMPVAAKRAPVVFADFEEGYAPWTVEGKAFGDAPARGGRGVQKLSGFEGNGLVNSWQDSDAARGKLVSPEFTIRYPYINFLIGGGNHPNQTCVNLLVDGRVVRTRTGADSDAMDWASFAVEDLLGKPARLEIVDDFAGAWGHVDVDQIEFAELPRSPRSALPLAERADFGTVALLLLGSGGGRVAAAAPRGADPAALFEAAAKVDDQTQESDGERPVGAIVRAALLAPGEDWSATFVLAWHFPNLTLPGFERPVGRQYASRFPHALAVAEEVAARLPDLAAETKRWRDTWYDSTLPYWFLDRTFANISTLATSTAQRFRDGRFYGWEGVGSCEGTCTHVWHYAWSVNRLFPEVERALASEVNFGVAFDPATGAIGHRGELAREAAVDGQAGAILRAWRVHLMSPDAKFLHQHWEKIKKALGWLIAKDPDRDGILDGDQPNTLDAAWYGRIAWTSSLYVAALRAGERMAAAMGDKDFEAECRAIAERGARNLGDGLFNGEYFVQVPDPKHTDAIGADSGCYIDQVIGQSWAWQADLGRILDADKVRSALRSLWKYNFAPDVAALRAAFREGRPFALPGEAGLVMCTWPKGGKRDDWKKHWQYGYFNECMTGFEHQAAAHMIREGLLEEGLAIERAIHDRYDASRRNPYNEIECGDHYARAMASYGAFIAICGFEHDGPAGSLGFAPRLRPEDFRAAYTTAESWGSIAQTRTPTQQIDTIQVRHGSLRLKSLHFEIPAGRALGATAVRVGAEVLPHSTALAGGEARIELVESRTLRREDTLTVTLDLA